MKKINIVIADNNNSSATKIKAYLSQKDNIGNIEVVDNGGEVLKLLNTNTIDVVICDLFTPIVDGFGVIESVNKMNLNKKPHIIITSIVQGNYIIEKLIELTDLNHYLSKPIDNEILYQRINNLCFKNINPTKDIECNVLNLFSQSNSAKSYIYSSTLHNDSYVKKDDTIVYNNDLNLEIEIINTLHKLGIPANIKGYRYLQDAIKMVVNNSNLLNVITKELYPSVADKNNTTPSRVERAIRHAIEVGGEKGNIFAMQDIFNLSISRGKSRPKNSEFIAKISEKIRLELVLNR